MNDFPGFYIGHMRAIVDIKNIFTTFACKYIFDFCGKVCSASKITNIARGRCCQEIVLVGTSDFIGPPRRQK